MSQWGEHKSKFLVSGTDSETGFQTELVLWASTWDEVRRRCIERGIDLPRITRLDSGASATDQTAASTATEDKENYDSATRAAGWKRIKGCFGGSYLILSLIMLIPPVTPIGVIMLCVWVGGVGGWQEYRAMEDVREIRKTLDKKKSKGELDH